MKIRYEVKVVEIGYFIYDREEKRNIVWLLNYNSNIWRGINEDD